MATEKATFAGGCFWCMETTFRQLPGIIDVFSGYANGTGTNPTYQDYAQKGYVEAVQITFDPTLVTYSQLLDVFWRQIDPTDAQGQFVDRGVHYRTAIFYHNPEQEKLATQSKKDLEKSKRFSGPIVTEIAPATNFYKAEGYHQNYAQENKAHYKAYRAGSGRDEFLKKMWEQEKKGNERLNASTGSQRASLKNNDTQFSDDELRSKLTQLQYDVMKKNKTEQPFTNEYCDNKKPGIYVDRISGKPLFSSLTKYDSGTGWPSFTQPLNPDEIITKEDLSHGMQRTEVRSKTSDAHLGHVFNDGPAPNGLRYCLNSAALRFIPLEDLEKEGYGKYKKLFVLRDASKDAPQDERE